MPYTCNYVCCNKKYDCYLTIADSGHSAQPVTVLSPTDTASPLTGLACLLIFDRPPKRSRAQELCESRGGRPGLPSLISLMVSVDVKQHSTTTTKEVSR